MAKSYRGDFSQPALPWLLAIAIMLLLFVWLISSGDEGQDAPSPYYSRRMTAIGEAIGTYIQSGPDFFPFGPYSIEAPPPETPPAVGTADTDAAADTDARQAP